MPSFNTLGAIYALLGLLGLIDYARVMGQQNPPQTCPAVLDISPCVCTVKKNGLDILCEATDLQHINKAMDVLKGKSPIIFYLKLRHNNLPKLQGFLFLALDIRHLTIHNSSLAAIEETALSSLGKYFTVEHMHEVLISLNVAVSIRASMARKEQYRLISTQVPKFCELF